MICKVGQTCWSLDRSQESGYRAHRIQDIKFTPLAQMVMIDAKWHKANSYFYDFDELMDCVYRMRPGVSCG